MDRYQIARKEVIKSGLFRFPPTNNVAQIIRYIDHCTKKSASFLADNIAIAVLEGALVKVSKLTGISILVKTQAQARILSMVYSHKPVYSLECYRDMGHYLNTAIYYNCDPIPEIKPYIVVYDKLI